MLEYAKPLDNTILFPIYFLQGPVWHTIKKGICLFCTIFAKLGGPKHGSRRDIGVFGNSAWTIVHKNSTFTGTEIAVISLIIVRF